MVSLQRWSWASMLVGVTAVTDHVGGLVQAVPGFAKHRGPVLWAHMEACLHFWKWALVSSWCSTHRGWRSRPYP